MPTRIEQNFEAGGGDLVAHSIKETDGDIAIAAGENTVPAGDADSPARAIVVGEKVELVGKIAFDGANAALGFTLPDDLLPLQPVADTCVVTDASATPTSALGIVTIDEDGVVSVAMVSGTAFANGDSVELNTSYIRA